MADPATSPAILSQPSLEAWGREVGSAAAAGGLSLPLVLALRGPLGAGKSVLARAIARGAGVSGPMPSPTYNLLFTYDLAGLVVHHLDLYRLEAPDDVWELGWEALGQGAEVVMIEWPERAESLLPGDRWEVRLGMADDEDAAAVGGTAGRPGAAGLAALRTVRVRPVGRVAEPPPLPASGAASGRAS